MDRRVFPYFILLAAWIGLGLWFCNKYICNASPADPGISQSSLAPAATPKKELWKFNDQTNFNHSSPDRFQFGLSGINLLNGGSDGLTEAITAIVTYLKANPDRGLDITGYYNGTIETNNTLMPNLGIARANVVKDMLMDAGVNGTQLSITGAILADTKYATDAGIMHGINFGFGAAVGDTRMSEIKARLFGIPLTVYFKTGSKSINFDAEQRQDLADMIYYLGNAADAKLNIDGHTDSKGRRSRNLELSQERAAFVAAYLSGKGGIDNGRMQVNGMGPDKPIQDNASSRGRAKNRRVEITLN